MKIFSYIKERISIFDVVNEYTTLKKAGSYYKGSCPFHHEKTASFTISPDKNIFYCFGCHESGDVIGFFAKIEQCSQFDAAKLLADKYKIEIPQELLSSSSSSSKEEKELYFTICSGVQEWCKQQLEKSNDISAYLIDRGFDAQTLTHFNVGYFPGGQRNIQNFIAYMRTKNVLLKDIVSVNILAEGRAVVYSPFENRIIFPISDVLGRTIGFGGRVCKPNDTRVKYYNSRENEYFSKGTILFGLEQAKYSIQKKKAVFLVEGYTDCLAMAQHGYPNTVATLGTACTIAHLKQLARYADRLYFVYDSDKAGKNALLRASQLCWQVNIEPFVVQLPPEYDPASYLQEHATIEPLITNAQNIFSFFIARSGDNFEEKSLQEKLDAIRSCTALIKHVDDPLKQNLLLQTAAKTFNMSLASLEKELVSSTKETNNSAPDTRKEFSDAPIYPNNSKLENRFFCGIISNIELLHNTHIQKLVTYLPEKLTSIISIIQQEQISESITNFQHVYTLLNQEQQKLISHIMLTEGQYADKETTIQIALQLQKQKWKNAVHEIKIKLAHAKQMQNNEIVPQLLAQLISIQKKLRVLNPDTMRMENGEKNS